MEENIRITLKCVSRVKVLSKEFKNRNQSKALQSYLCVGFGLFCWGVGLLISLGFSLNHVLAVPQAHFSKTAHL